MANGLVTGKILTAAPDAIPFKLAYDNHAANLGTENINWSIKLVARKTALSDKVSSKSVLEKAGLQTLNEMFASQTALMVWKSKKTKDPLGRTFFPSRSIRRQTRSINSVNASQPVPGNNTLAANLTVGTVKLIAWKWAQNLSILLLESLGVLWVLLQTIWL